MNFQRAIRKYQTLSETFLNYPSFYRWEGQARRNEALEATSSPSKLGLLVWICKLVFKHKKHMDCLEEMIMKAMKRGNKSTNSRSNSSFEESDRATVCCSWNTLWLSREYRFICGGFGSSYALQSCKRSQQSNSNTSSSSANQRFTTCKDSSCSWDTFVSKNKKREPWSQRRRLCNSPPS